LPLLDARLGPLTVGFFVEVVQLCRREFPIRGNSLLVLLKLKILPPDSGVTAAFPPLRGL
jgi:hypothetical protein